jgi:hypothetical protein
MVALAAADQAEQVGVGGANSGDLDLQGERVVRTALYTVPTAGRWLTNTDARGSSLLPRER